MSNNAKQPSTSQAQSMLITSVRSVLDGIAPAQMELLEAKAPTVARAINQIRTNASLGLPAIRQIVVDASNSMSLAEMLALRDHLPPDLAKRILGIIDKLLAPGQP